ncbi:MAG: hypothetical protein NVSMB19_14740 [Vulcanimicrobiaceae bacterium]
MVNSPETRRFAAALRSLQADVRAAGPDLARLDVLAGRLSRLAAEIALACERAFLLSVEAPAA